MNKNVFWQMIEEARRESEGNLVSEMQILIQSLVQKSEAEIKEFYFVYHSLLNEAYQASLWNACVLINCGCDEEIFGDFRAWLIAQGQDVFYKAIDNPETLEPLVSRDNRGEVSFEEFAYIALTAFEKKTGRDLEVDLPRSMTLVGDQIEQEKIPKKFPKLAHKLGDC
ncbi:MAG: DUF4240 domain-containing protein [Chloroflexota bacterium]